MQRREFVRAVISVGLLPKALLAQQTATPDPPPPAPVPWTLGLNPKTPCLSRKGPMESQRLRRTFYSGSTCDVHAALRFTAATAR
ncbi:hypothetical protein [Tunturiibacter gelidiferens]|uniref:hypothetical protein n=1 Tax=Tunturiibacter gelidiferens TaxID=3069689 RepID=UPI003D9BBB03